MICRAIKYLLILGRICEDFRSQSIPTQDRKNGNEEISLILSSVLFEHFTHDIHQIRLIVERLGFLPFRHPH